jgi:hypothetical protein
MKTYFPLVWLAISFALPTFAQQNAMVPNQQVIQQLVVLGQKVHEAYANNDAAAVAACYTWDAVIVTPQRTGLRSGRNRDLVCRPTRAMAPQKPYR